MNSKMLVIASIAVIALFAGTLFVFMHLWGGLISNYTELAAATGRRWGINCASCAPIDSLKTPTISEQTILSLKNSYIAEKKKFVLVDLRAMTLTLYGENGTSTEFKVLTKGRDGSWWETPSGNYSVVTKETNHFSSVGKVWQPWSIQFYGNFFIHGWPYYPGGSPVPQGYSGGCIRLGTDDAKKVFDFAERGTPVLVLDDKDAAKLTPPPLGFVKNVSVPDLSGSVALVMDLSRGDALLGKASDEPVPIASLTKLMTAVVASELIYLERLVTITQTMLAAPIQSFHFNVGDRYVAFDLFYPLLMESSNGAAAALASFIGEKNFVDNMNTKAVSLGMRDTVFADPAGMGDQNVSSAKDLIKLVRYILDKRFFIFDITRGKNYLNFGPLRLGNLKNFNEFAEKDNLIGMKNGETAAAGQTILSVWRLKDSENIERNVAVVVLGSDNRVQDTDRILNWLNEAFGLK